MRIRKALVLFLALLMLAGCAQTPVQQETEPEAEPTQQEAVSEAEDTTESVGYVDATPMVVEIADEMAALAESPAAVPALPDLPTAKASGTKEKRVTKAVIDYSNTKDGYVMVQFTAQTTKRIKAQVKGPATTYTYNVTPGQWEVFPLSDGNGKYQVGVYENVTGTKYAAVTSVSFDVALTDQFAPFLLANQYVNYTASSKIVAKAGELVKADMELLKKVEAVYNYVVTNLTYDTQKAATIKSGYLPVLDTVLEQKKGICFDYAALMTGMLRSQGVPCKLVVGYAGTAYHAWINVWSEKTGWVDGAIFFDGTTWQRMDPTFASSGKKSESIMKYIGNGANYTAKYLY